MTTRRAAGGRVVDDHLVQVGQYDLEGPVRDLVTAGSVATSACGTLKAPTRASLDDMHRAGLRSLAGCWRPPQLSRGSGLTG
jgi:hypothetical protein